MRFLGESVKHECRARLIKESCILHHKIPVTVETTPMNCEESSIGNRKTPNFFICCRSVTSIVLKLVFSVSDTNICG